MAKTETTKLQINQALLDANGDFSLAAVELGFTEIQLQDAVNSDHSLRTRWRAVAKAPSTTSIITRSEDPAIAEALAAENRKLQKGLKGMGLSTRAMTLAITCQQFQRDNYASVHQMTGGGMTKAFLEALEEVEKINNRLDNLDVPEEQRLAYESILREDRSKLLDFIHKAAAKVDQSILIQAKIQKLLGDGDGGKQKAGRPGFSALKKVNPAVTSE